MNEQVLAGLLTLGEAWAKLNFAPTWRFPVDTVSAVVLGELRALGYVKPVSFGLGSKRTPWQLTALGQHQVLAARAAAVT
jgi:hypothetical protein